MKAQGDKDPRAAREGLQLPEPVSAAVKAMLEQGLAHHRAGELVEAESLYRKALELAPGHPIALHLLGVLASQAGQNAVAVEYFDQAIAANPGFAQAHFGRGNALYALGQHAPAVESYSRAIALDPQNAEAYNNRGSALHELGQHQGALASYDQAIALNASYPEAPINRGNTLYTLGRHAEAVQSYERALAIQEDSTLAWRSRGTALHALGRREDAIASYERALALTPNDAGSWSNRANTLHSLGRYQEALENCERAIALDPNFADAWCNRANALCSLHSYLDALESADRAIALKPDLAEAHNNYGSVLCALSQYQDSIQSYDRAIALNPNYAEAHNNRGIALFNLSQYQAAIASYDRAIALKPGDDEIHFNRSHALQQYQSALESEEMAPLLRADFDSVMQEVKRIESIPDVPGRKAALDALPSELQSHPAVANFRSANFVKTLSSGRDLVFYCMPTGEIWNPRTASSKGIGGSEEAVIWLSRSLQKRGWNVTVYAGCGAQERMYDGVRWMPHWMWSYRDRQDVTVLWRHPRLALQPVNSGKLIVDLHDVVYEREFTPHSLGRIHRICVKSAFHRSLFPNIPDDKFAIIPNGIDAGLFEGAVERDRHLLINTSSPDRSLEAFIDCFEEIKRQVPAARAQWAYGWGGWDHYPLPSAVRRAWKPAMQARMREAGVEELGRLNHAEIVRLYHRANVFAYPSEMAEIDCISLTKAMAAGAIPVTTDFAAMGDKAGHGGVFLHSRKTKDDWIQPGQFHFEITDPTMKADFVRETVKLLLNPPSEDERAAMRAWARSTFDWERIADLWHQALQ